MIPKCDDGLERERSESGARVREKTEVVALQFGSLLSSSCRQERDAARQCGFFTGRFFSSRLYYWFVEHRLRERANRAISGTSGADESKRSDGWMERMDRVAPPFRCVLSSSSCRRAGSGVTMWNICLRRTLRAPINMSPFKLSIYNFSECDFFSSSKFFYLFCPPFFLSFFTKKMVERREQKNNNFCVSFCNCGF